MTSAINRRPLRVASKSSYVVGYSEAGCERRYYRKELSPVWAAIAEERVKLAEAKLAKDMAA